MTDPRPSKDTGDEVFEGRDVNLRRLQKRARKAVRLALVPAWRTALRMGVAATIEHDRLPLPRHAATVIDVGANRGQFAVYALERMPRAIVYSIEPLSAPRRRLERIAARNERLHVLPAALGAEPGTAVMHVSHRDDSSSLLAPTDMQTGTYPDTYEVGLEEVAVTTLDVIASTLALRRPILLKLDVQGYELNVLQGGTETLTAVDYVLTECSFREFYASQPLFGDVHALLDSRGFELCAGTVISGCNGEWTQGDFLYRRRVPVNPRGDVVPDPQEEVS